MTLEIKENVPLAPYTIYKIGGKARFFVEARNGDEVREALQFAAEKKLPFVIIGAGSNMLVSDRGFDGVAIRMTGGEVRVEDGERLVCDAGVMMARAVLAAAKAGLAGFEWGIGVPGTIGGSVRGNAGCFGSEMKDVIESVEIFDAQQSIRYSLSTMDCRFGYRDSIFSARGGSASGGKKHPEWIILSAVLKLKQGDVALIQQEVQRITLERLAKQDIGTKCCGCIFKNTPWGREDTDKEKLVKLFPELAMFAGQSHIPTSFLLDCAGLKGARMGGAMVSPKHANFFVNEGAASAEDVRALIDRAKEEVFKKFGVLVEEEIQYVG